MFILWDKYKKKFMASIVMLLVVFSLIGTGDSLSASLLENAIGFVVTPFQDLTTGVESWVVSTTEASRERTELIAENEALSEQLALLQEENKRLSLYEAENETLSGLLDIAQRFPEYESVGATVIAKSTSIWYDTFTINKGSTSGVSGNMVLVAPKGVVGKVLESGATYAKAQSILDSNSAVPAMSLRTGDLGVVKGDYILGNEGLCKMEYINQEAEIIVGDEIITSHLSDIYPVGISIGQVIEIEADANGLTKYAIIQPFVDLQHLDTVLVIDKNQEAGDVS
ncbi:rod shape-determining protein MreC [Chakrabartyella piscis]|uniref:rod shape-determining protein MreC n=1 Tax=Chakrabartyella piscis TaxID=2918914 RepID=UPI0029585DD4|nr:rod shape-determining protein MreC [Chakrabartyella piscis]